MVLLLSSLLLQLEMKDQPSSIPELEVSMGSLIEEYVINQLQLVFFMRFIVQVMILILMASALSGCIVGEFVQSP